MVEHIGRFDDQFRLNSSFAIDCDQFTDSEVHIGKAGPLPRVSPGIKRTVIVAGGVSVDVATSPRREGNAAAETHNRTQGHISEQMTQPAFSRTGFKGALKHPAHHKIMSNVKRRHAPLQIQSRWQKRGKRGVEINHVVNRFAVGVIRFKLNIVAKAFGERGGQPVINRVSN